MRPDAWVDGLLTITEVRHVHKMAMDAVWRLAPHPDATEAEAPGSYRQHDIQSFPSGMQPPSWVEVPMLIDDWVANFRPVAEKALSIERIADLHSAFERIHPFLDGNGRTGRLVMNLVLVRMGYPPAIIHKRDRDRYLAAIGRADRGEPGSLGEMVARAILDNLYRFIIPGLAGPRRVVPLAALATPELNIAALRTAAARGRLRAQKGSDGHWRSSQAWVEDYKANRYRRQR